MSRLIALFGAAVLFLSPGLAAAQQAGQPVPAAPTISYEYVQQASSMTFDGTTLTLRGVAPSTIFFSDRPYRTAGQVSTGQFAELWKAPGGAFSVTPPNAAVSVLGNVSDAPAIVELTSADMDGVELKYGVKIISGKLPESADNVALFVDHGPRPSSERNVGYYPYHPVPGPYCYHAPQAPECHYHPYHPYHPYYPPYPYHPYYYPGAAFAAGAAVGAAAANANQPQTYIYPIPAGPIPAHCYINSAHTRMICSVPIN
ncbi:hypothetical protein [Hoeflea prorocentri]|uniref:Uncharacterized protein n=1 Tax=Hoeflea prorocentri TaxID=1922333 RepID=A0A9X3ZI78_9HYPH|nr:hypothetical protein [Hoeflea prorocentri]MCY6381571.1 hypothetical protein [Hoeflea prorocentri]MDA5399371.1 hypothetical protein [Hoeflea prorocentri]